MVFLQTLDFVPPGLERMDGTSAHSRGPQGGHDRDSMRHRRAADRDLVPAGRLPMRGIDDELHFPILDQVEKIRASFREFVNQFRRDTRGLEDTQRAFRRMEPETCRAEFPGNRHDLVFVRILDADENIARFRQGRLGRHLRLGVGDAEVGIQAHHFAGGAHLRPEGDVDAGKLDERKYRFFNRIM